jgi:tartrate dehydrogenase/decarboxylase/D-malate dehydrogenase
MSTAQPRHQTSATDPTQGGSSAQPLRIAAIPGDGIGPEVVGAALQVLQAATARTGDRLQIEHLDWGGERYLLEGAPMPAGAAAILRSYDAVLFGAVGRPDVADHVLVWGLILSLRQQLDLYVNLRPCHAWPDIPSPVPASAGVDFVVVRENTEGEYTGAGGLSHQDTPAETAIEVAVHTRMGIERIARYAFDLAGTRRGVVQAVTKSNASRYGYVLWDEVVREVATDYPDITLEIVLVDAMAARMIERPHSLDVVLSSNLFGDILSDLAAPLQGGMGMAPSGNFRPDRMAPGIFEPVHGSAPSLAGTGHANPIGCILSAAMLLEHNNFTEAAALIRRAVGHALADRAARTPDLGGAATTGQLTERVVREIEAAEIRHAHHRA